MVALEKMRGKVSIVTRDCKQQNIKKTDLHPLLQQNYISHTTNNGAFLENLSNKKLTSLKVALYLALARLKVSHVAMTIINQIEWIEKGRHLSLFY